MIVILPLVPWSFHTYLMCSYCIVIQNTLSSLIIEIALKHQFLASQLIHHYLIVSFLFDWYHSVPSHKEYLTHNLLNKPKPWWLALLLFLPLKKKCFLHPPLKLGPYLSTSLTWKIFRRVINSHCLNFLHSFLNLQLGFCNIPTVPSPTQVDTTTPTTGLTLLSPFNHLQGAKYDGKVSGYLFKNKILTKRPKVGYLDLAPIFSNLTFYYSYYSPKPASAILYMVLQIHQACSHTWTFGLDASLSPAFLFFLLPPEWLCQFTS